MRPTEPQGGFKIRARTAMSARSWLQIQFGRTRLSALLFPRFLNPPSTSHIPVLLSARSRGKTLCVMTNSSPGGQVASLHLHPLEPGAPLKQVEAIEVIAGKGIADEPRYFGRINRSSGEPSPRQISLIEREQI